MMDSNSDNMDLLLGEPLDTMQVQISGKNHIQQIVPALHIGFMELREFLHFQPVPLKPEQGDALTAEEEEFLEYASCYEDDLHWLLRLPHHRFWSQVIYDENLHKSLESYLTNAPRDYDREYLEVREEVKSSLMKIHRLVFLVFLRMSTYKESKEHHIRPSAYGDLIYDNYVFDIPKLMDICVLYGFQNKALVTKMLKNIFHCQPKYLEDLNETSAVALNALDFAEEKLCLNESDDLKACRKIDDGCPNGVQDIPLLMLIDVTTFITDTCATIYMFLEIYSPACRIFHQNGALKLVGFYEKAFSAIQREVKRHERTNVKDNDLDAIKRKVTLAKSFIIKIFRNIISYCCIQHILDPNCTEERFSYSLPEEEFLAIFMEIACEKSFLRDYNLVYPFENDMELMIQSGIHLDSQRLDYIFESIYDAPQSTVPTTYVSSPDNGARPKIKSPSSGAVKNMQSVAAVLKPEEKSDQNGDAFLEPKFDWEPDEVEMQSLIHEVKDIFNDLGEGFIEEGLKYYNYDSEKFINALFEKELPEKISQIDRNLSRTPKTAKSSVLSERKNIYDNDEFDLFSRDDVNMENIHLGKKNKTPDSYQTLNTEEDSEFLKNLICTYGEQESDEEDFGRPRVNLYEDEYDDTYDSALVGQKEPILEDEPDDEPVQEETPKEGVRGYKPGDFCENPEITRQRYAERQAARAAARGKGKRGGGPPSNPSQSKAQKDRNKAYVGNHNRRNQSDYKRSRGMLPSS